MFSLELSHVTTCWVAKESTRLKHAAEKLVGRHALSPDSAPSPREPLSGGRWQRHQHGREQQYRDERGELTLPPALGGTDALPSGGHREGEYQYQRGELRHDEASVRGVREIARSREVLKCQQRAASRRDQERNARDAPRPSRDGRAQLGDTRGLPRHE